MKSVIILPDGAADHPLAELDGQTPLAAAPTPAMDWIARTGRIGRALTVPPGFVPGTDVATLSLFGYEPDQYYPGRAPLEAAAQGLTAGPDELIFRCNFVTISDGRMHDFTADHIDQAEADELIDMLNQHLGNDKIRFHAGVSYRNLMIAGGLRDAQLESTAPHDIPDQPVGDHLPRGNVSTWVCGLMQRAHQLLKDHPVNHRRALAGRPPVTDIWLWGQGRPVNVPSMQSRFGVRGVVITAVDIIRGLARMAGLDLRAVEGATGFIDTNYAGKGRAAVEALEDYDLVMVHIEAPDEAAHMGSAAEKIRALQEIDRKIVAPVVQALQRYPEWRIMIAPDHPTLVSTKAHHADPPPFCYATHAAGKSNAVGFSEFEAERVGDWVAHGHNLLGEFFAAPRVAVPAAKSA
jgi:2,3-bisphosphoglycerate-independent phosphoglycerate mutase